MSQSVTSGPVYLLTLPFSSIYCSPLCAGVYARLSWARCRDRSVQIPILRSTLSVRPQGSTPQRNLWWFCWCSIAGNDLEFLRHISSVFLSFKNGNDYIHLCLSVFLSLFFFLLQLSSSNEEVFLLWSYSTHVYPLFLSSCCIWDTLTLKHL